LTSVTNTQNGEFSLSLQPGTYDMTVLATSTPLPLQFTGIRVEAGKVTYLAPFDLTPLRGKGAVSGKVIPACPNAEVKLIYEGKERAAIRTDNEGKFEFRELPTGSYLITANAPGHAKDSIPITLGENQNLEQNASLLPISPVNGVDWSTGTIRATGIGLPPHNPSNSTVRHEMAKRAALVDGERNLLKTIEQIRISEYRDIKEAMRVHTFAVRIQGFIKGYTVISERELEDGKVEIVLELPLTGPSGLSRYIQE